MAEAQQSARGQWPGQTVLDPWMATRRQFLASGPIGLGAIALACLSQAEGASPVASPMAPRPPHFPARARSVIFLFMAGGPSQLDLFDYKPKLQELHGQVIPPSFVENKRFAFIKKDATLLASPRKFSKRGESGAEMSELLPHLHAVGDELCIIRTMATDVFNHGPAKLFMNTGSPQFSGRPSMGSWITYGLGSESQELPGFVVLQSGPRGPRGGAALWSSGFLPTSFQGVPFRSTGEPILYLSSPSGINRARQEAFTRAVQDLNRLRFDHTADPEILTRIASYELAFRMQVSAPELMDLSDETDETLRLYGAEPGRVSFANNCLLARRLVERGVRFVQLYHTDWDHHGNKGTDLGEALEARCREVDQPCAALILDLKRRGLLDETLVIWGGEFGRTPQGEPRDFMGRDHHIEAFTMWLAGGGIRVGQTVGKTDEIGYYPVEDRIHVHDLQATILHLLGLDHTRLTFRFQGRDFRLTDVGGRVVEKLLA
ncbi:MAG: sulfatase [Pirellulaceae bacterium]|nr:MAG: sulfatase [Pirellulaceae bacterium]